jgi:hypothetical protein
MRTDIGQDSTARKEVRGILGKQFEIQQDLPFQYRHWRRERIGWVALACIVAAGLLGIFGHHPLARTTNQTANRTMAIQYDRFARYESSAEIVVEVKPEKQGDGIIRLWFDTGYLDSIKVLSISPLPLRGETRDGGRDLIVQTDGTPLTIRLCFEFQEIGLVRGRVRVNEGEVLPVTHFVWP